MNGLTLATVKAGAVLMCAFPVILLIFGIIMVRAGRRGELAASSSQAGMWLSGIGLVGILLAFAGSNSRLPALNWVAIGLVIISAALCGWFLRTPLTRPLKVVAGLLLFELLFVAAFGSFAIWIAGKAAQISAYNNPNEAEVRAALAKNSNDAAAHSSLAQIDMMRGDHAGEMTEWRQVLRVEPDNGDALFLLGARLTRTGRADEAKPLYQKLAAGNSAYAVSARRWLARHGTQ